MTYLMIAAALLGANEWDEFRKLSASPGVDARCNAIELVRRQKDAPMARALLPMLADPHPRVVYRAVRALAAAEDPAVLEVLHENGLDHKDPRVRRGAAEALGLAGKRESVEPLLAALRDRRPEAAAAAAEALGRIADKAAVPGLLKACESRHVEVRTSALEALVKTDPASAADPLREAARSRDPGARMAAAELAPAVSPELALESYESLLADRDWRVRVGAVEASMVIRRREVIGPLIDRLGEEEGRLRWDILSALGDLTGKDLGLAAGPWRDWWAVNRETFRVPERKAGDDSKAPVSGTTCSFFDVPILSNRIIFILDLSGSMEAYKAPGRADATMLDVAKQGLAEAIISLGRDVQFGITGTGGDKDHGFSLRHEKTWGGRIRLHAASPGGKASALRFTSALRSGGYSNDYDAVAYALGNDEVDTIYLYSDGGASRGTFWAIEEMLDNVAKLNRTRKVMIHAIEVPGQKENQPGNVRFLRSLASLTGGVYRKYDWKPPEPGKP